MATVVRILAVLAVASTVIATDPETITPDTLAPDTSITALLDSTATAPHTVTSGWFIPLAIIGATAGVFVILFSARTKS